MRTKAIHSRKFYLHRLPGRCVFSLRLTFHVPLGATVHRLNNGVLVISQLHQGGEKLHLIGGQLRFLVLRVFQVVDGDGLVAKERNG